ncbi:MAG: class I SAM-dependent methyltransferase [Roseomonas sp.]|nr:class I SAM-dependent methyltransferase [Roseomonas sp.]
MSEDARRFAPAVARNKAPITDVLARHLPPTGLVLEIASGSGEHALHFAAQFPALNFQPSDPDAAALASIAAWREETRLPNFLPPLMLDVMADAWPIQRADAVLCINMIHIAPWEATAALLQGAARILPPGAMLFLYGPFKQGGHHTAPSNAEFDASLRVQDMRWGVRDLEAVAEIARAAGFAAPVVEAMPANNLSLILRRLP